MEDFTESMEEIIGYEYGMWSTFASVIFLVSKSLKNSLYHAKILHNTSDFSPIVAF